MQRSSLAENLYDKLLNEEDARACRDIDENACREVPGNFLWMIVSHFFSKLGDAVANPKIVLPWVMETIHAPLYLISFLVPIRESGSLIPQLLIAGFVRRQPIRKGLWVAGSLVQALTMAGIGLIAWRFEGALAGWLIIVLLILFSLARGLSSVAAKDVIGKTIPKSQRGQVNGWSASSAGLVTVLFASVLISGAANSLDPLSCGLLLGGAGLLWVIAAICYAQIKEFSGETGGGANALSTALSHLSLLSTDKPFRRFVITRALLLCSALTAPYYVVLAQKKIGTPGYLLGLFVLASGAASLLSAPFWGRFADQSSRKVMIAAAIITALLGISVFVIEQFQSQWLATIWVLPCVYFLLSIAHQGVRIGRKTYVIDLAKGNRRTDYVAVSNSLIGVVLLLMGLSGALSTWLNISTIILVLSVLGLFGALLGRSLPEVE